MCLQLLEQRDEFLGGETTAADHVVLEGGLAAHEDVVDAEFALQVLQHMSSFVES